MRLHPATVLTAGACAWVWVVGLNRPVVSVAIAVAALTLGTVAARSSGVVVSTVALAVPAAASMVLIHAPYGQHRIAPLLTSDGLLLAGVLSLRFLALIACFIAAAACLRVSEVAKWIQGSRGGYKLAYVVGASLQAIPQGAQAVAAVRDANALEAASTPSGRPARHGQGLRTLLPRFIVPVIARLLTQGAQRGHALAALGFDSAGPRTVYRPVPDARWQRVVRWVLVASSAAVLLWHAMGVSA